MQSNQKDQKNKSTFKSADVDKELDDALYHYNQWTDDNQIRLTRKNGWSDITDAYWGRLPLDWPYISKVVDPRIRTSLIEKNARLLNAKLRGRLVPREGGDVMGARLNNALLDFQWDNAQNGGTMLSKWGMMDMDTRLYGSKFGLVIWRYEVEEDGTVTFCGNEFKPLDIRDCGMDSNCDNIRDASWFQYREWKKIEELDEVSETTGKAKYPGLSELKVKISEGRSDRRDNAYQDRVLTLKGLPDRVGDDLSFPVVELVHEFRKDKWVTFAPRYKVKLRSITNPYNHKKIPVVQLRYYGIQGDPLGESEVEPVISIWRAIQACVCGYLDEMNIKMRPPIKILDSKARIETIIFAPEAQWLVDQVDAVTEYQSSSEGMQTFQTVYSSLTSAFNTAMGDTSQGVSSVDPFNPQKTATEVRQSAKQQNTRDQKNQTSLAEAIEDMMSMWIANNKQFLFTDQTKKEYILRILGTELFAYFQRAGLDGMEVTPQAMQAISDVITAQGGNVSDGDIQSLMEAGKTPKYPVFTNPQEKNPAKLQYKPKMAIASTGDSAEVTLTPDDLNGNYDYIADVRSMATGADTDQQNARQTAITSLTTNPIVLQLLSAQGVTPQIKELLVANLEDLGLKDAERFFQSQPPAPPVPTAPATPGVGGSQPNLPVNGLPTNPAAPAPGGVQPPVAQPQGLPQPGQVPGGLLPGPSQGGGLSQFG